MERLDLIEAPRHQSVEAAIHLARYALALAHCSGRYVLDVACGEGYGSILMKLMGAKRVEGIDISEDAIAKARHYCRTNGVRFQCADALRIDKLFPKDTFDLVVSIETLEHVADPEAFLRAIKAVAKDNATIILTCPNDHWYYPDDTQSNPYHVRKYTLNEFQRLTTRILGRNVSWALGTGVLGFGTVPWSHSRQQFSKLTRHGWLKWKPQQAALLVPASPPNTHVSDKNCSYFVGTWGGKSHFVTGSAVFPLGMDKFMPLINLLSENVHGARRHSPVEAELASVKANFERREAELEEEARKNRLQAEVLIKETEILQARLPALEAELASTKAKSERREAERHELEKEARKYRLQAAVLIKETEILQARLPALEAELASAKAIQARLPVLEAELASAKAHFGLLSQEHKRLLMRWNTVMAVPRRIVPPAWRPAIKRALLKMFSRNVIR